MLVGDLVFYKDFSIDPHKTTTEEHAGIIVSFEGKYKGAQVITVFTKQQLLPFFDYELYNE